MSAVFSVSALRFGLLRAINYTPEVESIRRHAAKAASVPLGSLLSSMGPAYGSVFTRLDCHPSQGIELVSQADMFAAEPSGRVIRRDSMKHPERHEIKKWQILIAGAGTLGETELYGRSLVADGRLVGKYVGPHAMVLTFKEPGGDLNLFTYAFLSTVIGVRAVRSASYGTKILGLRKDLLAELPIPQPSAEIVRDVASLVRAAAESRERYLTELRLARKVVEDLPEMQQALAMCADRQARCISWENEMPSLSAWNFASVGNALHHLSKSWKTRLRDVVPPHGIFNGPRFARIPCRAPHGVEFVSQRQVFLIKPVSRRIAHPGFAEDKLSVPQDSLLIGGHGTLGEGEIFGRVEYVSPRFSRTAFTQDILRIQPRRELSELAYAYLSTVVGFRLLRSTAVGTKILSMRPDLLLALPFPNASPALCERVSKHVRASLAAREAADQADREAVRVLEEQVLPKWLE